MSRKPPPRQYATVAPPAAQNEKQPSTVRQVLQQSIRQQRGLSKLLHAGTTTSDTPHLLRQVVRLLSSEKLCPGCSAVIVRFQGEVYSTKGYRKSKCTLKATRKTTTGDTLTIAVSYSPQLPIATDAIGLKEQQQFIETVAETVAASLHQLLLRNKHEREDDGWNSTIEALPECVQIINRQGVVERINAAGLQLLEMTSPGQIVGAHLFKLKKLLSPADKKEVKRLFKAACDGYQVEGRYRLVTRKGTRKWVESVLIPLPTATGKIKVVMCVTRDVTHKIEAGKHLEMILSNQDAMINSTQDFIWSVDRELKLMAANTAFLQMMQSATGRHFQPGDSVIQKPFGKQPLARWKHYYQRALKGETITIRETFIHPDTNQQRFTIGTISPIQDHPGKSVVGVACYTKDITQLTNQQLELEKILNSSLDMICTIDQAGRFVKVSPASQTILGYSPDELQGRYNMELVYEADKPKTEKAAQAIMSGINMTNFENRYVQRDGTPVELVWSARWDQEDQLMYCVAKDATVRKQAEREITLMVNNTEEAFVMVDKELCVRSFNHQFADLYARYFGVTVEVGTSIVHYAQPERKKEVEKIYHRVLQGKQVEAEISVPVQDGPVRFFAILYKPARDEYNHIVGAFVSINDITDKKRAVTELRESEERYRLLFDDSPLPKWIYDIETLEILDANQMAVSVYGYALEEYRSMSILAMRSKAEVDDTLKMVRSKTGKNKSHRLGIYTHQRKNGSSMQAEVFVHRLHFKGRECVVAVSIDVTERDAILRQLRENEARLTKAQQLAKLGYWQLQLDGRQLYWSDEVYHIWGVDKASFDLNFNSFFESIHPEDREIFLEAQAPAFKGIQTYDVEFRIVLPDGSMKWVHDFGKLEYDPAGKPVLFEGTVQDITERKKEEQRLKLLESVIINANDSVVITEAESVNGSGRRIVYVNNAFTTMTGYTADEVIGKTPKLLQGPKSDQQELKRLDEALNKWESCEVTTINYKKNGEEFWVNFTVNPVADEKGWFTHWIAIERDVSKQKLEAIEKEFLTQISTIFSTETELRNALQAVCRELALFAPFDFCEVWLPTVNSGKLRLVATHSEGAAGDTFYVHAADCNEVESGQGLPGMVWQQRSSVYQDQLRSPHHFLRQNAALEAGIKYIAGIPLLHQHELVGVLLAGATTPIKTVAQRETILKKMEGHIGAEINRKRLEHELQQLFEFIPDLICLTDFSGRFLKVNPAVSDLLGYSANELIGTSFGQYIHPDDKSAALAAMDKLKRGEAILNLENRCLTKSGRVIWLSWNCTSSIEEGMVFATAKDITVEKKLSQLVADATQLARIGGWEVDLITHRVYWSPLVHHMHETDPALFHPDLQTAIQFYRHDFRDQVSAAIQHSIHTGKPFDFEAVIITAKGNSLWVRSIGQAEILKGECIRIYGSFQDINMQKQTQLRLQAITDDLQKAYEEKTNIIESIADAFFTTDKNFTVTYWNRVAENLLGVSRNQLIGKNLWDVFPDAVDLPSYTNYHQVLATGQPITFEDYYGRWLEVNAYPSEEGLTVFFRDITLRKEADARLRKAFEERNEILESISDAFFAVDTHWTVTYWNSKAEQILGNPKEHVVGKNLWQVYADAVGLKFYEEYHQAMKTGQVTRFEEYYPTTNAWFEVTAYPSARGLSIYFKDISERKIAEQRLSAINHTLRIKTMELSATNKELEQFAYVASHDLQEPLRMVTSFLTKIEERYEPLLDDKGKKYIHLAVDGAVRMRRIILDLLEYSRTTRMSIEIEPINLNEVLQEEIRLNRMVIEEKKANIVYGDLPVIYAARPPVQQLFRNLIGNALKYAKPDVPPVIEVSYDESGTHWIFRVKDNGIGIAPEFHDKLFILFQRLHNKNEYSGTGIGLAICKKIVQKLGGEIRVESTENEGATFVFTIKKNAIDS